MQEARVILASASPRRVELMSLAGIEFDAMPADICENVLPGELPADHVMRLSFEKAQAVSERVEARFFIGADTVVVLDNRIMGKPVDEAEAAEMLTALSGRSHEVITGFTVFDKLSGKYSSKNVSTEVNFKALTPYEIEKYIATGCPMDKAGAYAIQGGAVHFIRSIKGSYTNVIGLPMTELCELLIEMKAMEP